MTRHRPITATYRFGSLPGRFRTNSWSATTGMATLPIRSISILDIHCALAHGGEAGQSSSCVDVTASAIGPLTAQQLFVIAASGVDTNPGTREQPLRPVTEAARRINGDSTYRPAATITSDDLLVGESRNGSGSAIHGRPGLLLQEPEADPADLSDLARR